MLYTDAGYTNVYQGGGGQEFLYASSDSNDALAINFAVEICGIPGGGFVVGQVKSVTTGPTYSIDFKDTSDNVITAVDENTPFKIVITENGIPAMKPFLTAGGSATAADFDSWPFITNAITNAEELELNFIINGSPIEVNLTTAEDFLTDGNETFTVQLTDGTLASIVINDTSTSTTSSTTTTTTTQPPNDPPVLDTPNASTDDVTQNGTPFTDQVVIDLSQHTQDPDGDAMTWKILSQPTSGTVRDNATPGVDIVVFPHTLGTDSNGDNYKVIYRPGNTGAPSTATFSWTAEDGISTQTNTATATINILQPANQPPTADPISETLVADGTTNSVTFTRTGSDDSGITPTFSWTDQNGNAISGLPSLTHGSLQQLGSGETFQYTQNTGLIVNPGSSPLEDSFYYIATDNVGVPSQVAQVQIQNVDPGNTAPAFDVTPGAAIEITAGTPYQVTGITATDPEGHDPVTIVIDNTGGTDTNATATFNGGILTVTGTAAGTVTVTLKATDSFGLTDPSNNITYTFNVVEVAYRPVRKSVFTNSDSSACALERPIGDAYYYSTAPNGTTFLPNLAVGAFIYTDSGLNNPVIPASASSPWISLEENLGNTAQIRAVKLNATTGAIEEILNCTVTGGNAWPILVKFNATVEGYCNDVYDEVEVWQNISETATLADVVAANGQLFGDEYYANQYVGSTAPSEYIVEDGAYSDANMSTGQYYFWNNPAWAATGISGATDPNLFECPPPIVYDTRSLDVYFYSPDPADIGAVCNAQNGLSWQDAQANFNLVTIYYRKDVTDLSTWSLLDLAKAQTFIWTTQADADTLNYQMLHPSAILLDVNSGGLVLWDNDNATGFAGSYSWYAFSQDDADITTLDNLLEVADANSGYGFCGDGITNPLADYNRPAIWDIGIGNSITVGTTSGSRNNLYFAFFPCDVELDPGIPGGAPYYPLYIVDAMAESIEITDVNTTSYLNTFAQTITRTGPAPNNDTRAQIKIGGNCLLYTSPSPRDVEESRMPSSA